jgi:predicted DNA-binding protein
MPREVAEETKQTAFRLPVSLLERIDAHQKHVESAFPGIKFSRADIVRQLLERALRLYEEDPKRSE